MSEYEYSSCPYYLDGENHAVQPEFDPSLYPFDLKPTMLAPQVPPELSIIGPYPFTPPAESSDYDEHAGYQYQYQPLTWNQFEEHDYPNQAINPGVTLKSENETPAAFDWAAWHSASGLGISGNVQDEYQSRQELCGYNYSPSSTCETISTGSELSLAPFESFEYTNGDGYGYVPGNEDASDAINIDLNALPPHDELGQIIRGEFARGLYLCSYISDSGQWRLEHVDVAAGSGDKIHAQDDQLMSHNTAHWSAQEGSHVPQYAQT